MNPQTHTNPDRRLLEKIREILDNADRVPCRNCGELVTNAAPCFHCGTFAGPAGASA